MGRRLELTEEDIQAGVKQAAEMVRWKYQHVRIPFMSSRGWPDITLLTPLGWLIFLEVKVKAAVTPLQREWLDNLALVPGAGCVGILRPLHYDAVLQAISSDTPPPGGVWQEINQAWKIESKKLRQKGV